MATKEIGPCMEYFKNNMDLIKTKILKTSKALFNRTQSPMMISGLVNSVLITTR